MGERGGRGKEKLLKQEILKYERNKTKSKMERSALTLEK